MKIILNITVIMILVSYTAAMMAEERCGREAGGRTCKHYRCCSEFSYCGTQSEYCSTDCQSNCWSGPSGSNVTAFWANYNAKHNKYDMHVVKTECSTLDADKPYAWRSKYGWTAFCAPTGPRGQDACGKCLKVTNTRTNKVVKLRIVDECGDGGLNIDHELFKTLDNDGHGNEQGHLDVDYQFISCDDKVSGHPDFNNIFGSVIDRV